MLLESMNAVTLRQDLQLLFTFSSSSQLQLYIQQCRQFPFLCAYRARPPSARNTLYVHAFINMFPNLHVQVDPDTCYEQGIV